jgi:hypothetical protein
MATPTIQIKQELDGFCSNGDLSEEAKRRYIAEACERAQADYREAIQTEERKIREQAEKALFETPYPIAADEAEKARYSPLRRGAYEGVYGSLVLFEGEEAREELERLLTRAERTQDPELADAYLGKRPKAKKRWEEYVAAKQEANSLDRKLGLTMDFGLMKPAELIDQPVGSSAA